jgi:hypothetical protein
MSGLALSALVSANAAYSSVSPSASWASAWKPTKACARTTTVTEWVTVPDARDVWGTPIPVTTAYPVNPLPYGRRDTH